MNDQEDIEKYFWNQENLAKLKFGKQVACVASVSNRVIARKFHFFFCSCPSFLDEPREETLATQARKQGGRVCGAFLSCP